MLVSTISFGVKLGTIKGLSKLSNYNELKDVDVSDITTLKIINGIPRQPGKGFSGVSSSLFRWENYWIIHHKKMVKIMENFMLIQIMDN